LSLERGGQLDGLVLLHDPASRRYLGAKSVHVHHTRPRRQLQALEGVATTCSKLEVRATASTKQCTSGQEQIPAT
jgi:hypothetical protein